MIKYLLPLFALWGAGSLFAQCPEVLNCTSDTDTLCDLSLNDTLLWDQNVWWDSAIGSHNLTEAPADLNLRVLDTCAGTTVRFLLYLDLNDDGVLETVVDSDDLPAAGLIRFDNVATPGQFLTFDERPVAAGEKYRFALQQSLSGDTLTAGIRWNTDAAPGSFILPELPAKKYRVVWLIGAAGNTQTCMRDVVVHDCLPPVVTCQTMLSFNLMPGGFTTVWATDFLKSAADNITPAGQLQFAVRKAGAGSGFPVDNEGSPIVLVTFDCCDLGENLVELWARDVAGNSAYCLAYMDFQDNNSNCNGFCKDPLLACAKTFWDKEAIEDMTFDLTVKPVVSLFDVVDAFGCAYFNSVLEPGVSYVLAATKDDNPLNGVSTFDLVLMSKHILGLEPLDAPWKILAADANRSNSLTTFDVVELRKLILGIYTKLPNNTSWRFIPGGYVFSDPANPFISAVPDTLFVDNLLQSGPVQHTFNGYKVGDVNGSAVANSLRPAPEERGSLTLSLPDVRLARGETAEIALRPTEAGAWNGLQMALAYDPEKIEIEYVAPAGLPALDEKAWAKPRPGTLSISWFDARPYTVLPGDELFRLRLRALSGGLLSDLLSLTPATLTPEVYGADGKARGLHLHFGQTEIPDGPTVIFPPHPNPTTAGISLPLRLDSSGSVHLAVADVSGRILFRQELWLESGAHVLEIPGTAFPQKGVYLLHADARSIARIEKIVRH